MATVIGDNDGSQQGAWSCDRCTFNNTEEDLCCLMCDNKRIQVMKFAYQWEWFAEDRSWLPYDIPTARQIEDAYQTKCLKLTMNAGWFASQSSRYEMYLNYKRRQFIQVNADTGTCRRVRRIADDDNSLLQPVGSLTKQDKCIICLEYFMGDDEDEKANAETVGNAKTSVDEECLENSSSISTSSMSTASSSSTLAVSAVAFENGPTKNSENVGDCVSNADAEKEEDSEDFVFEPEACLDGPSGVQSLKPSADDPVKLPQCTGHYFHRACIAQCIKLTDKCPICKKPCLY